MQTEHDLDCSGIYCIRNTGNGKMYVGSAVTIKTRFAVHLSELKSAKHHSIKLQRAWNKYGELSFEFCVLEFCEDRTILVEREQHWIDFHNSFSNGYNVNPRATSSLGVKRSAETRAKVSAAVKELARDPEVKERLSRRASEYMAVPENRIKLGNAIKAAWAAKSPAERIEASAKRRASMRSPETRAKISASRTGRKASVETKKKLSLARAGIVQSEATKAKRRATLMGHIVSAETREKIRQANLGWKPNEQQLENARLARIRRYQHQRVGQ